MSDKSKTNGSVQSLSRAFKLLNLLSESERGLTLNDLAGGAGLAASTAHRLLTTMRQEGYVEHDEQTALWSVGLHAFTVGNAYLKKRDFIAQSRLFMRSLVADTGETSNLAVLNGDHHVFLTQIECSQMMRMVTHLGRPGPAHAAGVGKALLSALTAREVASLVRRTGLKPLTKNTISTPSALLLELDKVRSQGYAIDNEEQALGLRCIAANIYDEHNNAIAAVSISGPSVRMPLERVAALSAAVMDTASQITDAIGGVAPNS